MGLGLGLRRERRKGAGGEGGGCVGCGLWVVVYGLGGLLTAG